MPTELKPDEAIPATLPSDLAQIVGSVFESMLDIQAGACQMTWQPSSDRMAAAVHLTGDWNLAVLLECDPRQACQFAARFLAKDSPVADSDDKSTDGDAAAFAAPYMMDDVVRDVLGELANMIAGNLKCVLTGSIRLSMPTVVDGRDALRICGSELCERIAVECLDGIFWVTVFRRYPEREKDAGR